MDRLATLNQALMRGLPSCRRIFGGSAHFSTSLPLLAFVKNVGLLNPYLDPACIGGGFAPWRTRQGWGEASTRGGAYASLLAQQLDGRLALADSLRMAARVGLAVTPSADEALRDLGTFAGGSHLSAVAELLCLIERLEELHTKVQGMISYSHLATTFLFDVSLRWSQYHNRCVAASASEVEEAPRNSVRPIMVELEGGRYIGPILSAALADLVSGRRSAGGSAPKGGGGGGSSGGSGGGGSGGGGVGGGGGGVSKQNIMCPW